MNTLKYIFFFALLAITVTSCTDEEGIIQDEMLADEVKINGSSLNIKLDNRSVISSEALALYCDAVVDVIDGDSLIAIVSVVTNSQEFIDLYEVSTDPFEDVEFYSEQLEEGDFFMYNIRFAENVPNENAADLTFFEVKLDLGQGLKLYTNHNFTAKANFSVLTYDNIEGSFSGDLYNENNEVVGDFSGDFATEHISLDCL